MKLQKVVSALALCLVATAQNATVQNVNAQEMTNDTSSTRSTQNVAQDWVTLRLNLRAGDTFRITDRTRDKSVQVTPETTDEYASRIETLTDTTQISEYRVLYLHADGAAQVRVSYGDYKTQISVNGKPRSDTSSQNPWRGVQIEMKIAPDGRVSDVRGGDKIWRAVIASPEFDDFTAEQRREMEGFIKQALGDDAIKHLFEQAGMSFPQNPVRIGQSWFQRVQTKGLMPLTIHLKRTVTSRKSGLINILDEGTLSMGDKAPTSFDGVKMQMSGTFSGSTQIDQSSGFTHAAFYTTRLGGTTTYETKSKPLVTRDYTLSTTRLSVQKLP